MHPPRAAPRLCAGGRKNVHRSAYDVLVRDAVPGFLYEGGHGMYMTLRPPDVTGLFLAVEHRHVAIGGQTSCRFLIDSGGGAS